MAAVAFGEGWLPRLKNANVLNDLFQLSKNANRRTND